MSMRQDNKVSYCYHLCFKNTEESSSPGKMEKLKSHSHLSPMILASKKKEMQRYGNYSLLRQ
ncbi:hypothetical protein SK128_012281 [Halocaridina rubra]|uniref:Uncharacterized protein n=1 Tax=Halocaridina rubra TaxID=373956 RepID=A0AAN9ABV7_HALRR